MLNHGVPYSAVPNEERMAVITAMWQDFHLPTIGGAEEQCRDVKRRRDSCRRFRANWPVWVEDTRLDKGLRCCYRSGMGIPHTIDAWISFGYELKDASR